MPSLRIAAVATLAAVASALPGLPLLDKRQLQYYEVAKRQNAGAAALGLGDFDILQFALTLEHLEEAFYRQGFALFPDEDFAALGLNEVQIEDLKKIGKTEEAHVTFIQSALAQGGVAPVQLCEYEFGFTDAAGMVATAAILENVGVSAYLGAAPLLADPAILGVAGSILTIEARHQSSIRVFAGDIAVPTAFDVPLGPRSVFSLAAPFFVSCPEGSNLAIEPFPALALAADVDPAAIRADVSIRLTSDVAASATHCAFTAGGIFPGGTRFTTFTEGEGCIVPQQLGGLVYVSLTNSANLEGVLTDDIVVAGHAIVQIS